MPTATDKITQNLNTALAHLRRGDVVAFPTETVYGLGADALDELAIKKVFTVKGRPADHPLIVHIASAKELNSWAIDIPPSAWVLAEHFWPGPLTMILSKLPKVSSLITGGQNTIALRVPNHALTLELIKQFGSGLVGPSANKYGHVSPTTAMHVAADFGNELGAILDGGACNIGIESTIIDLTKATPTIMRQGMISAAQIATVLNTEVQMQNNTQTTTRTPGGDESHYAPYAPLHLIKSTEFIASVTQHITKTKNFSVISFQAKPNDLPATIYWQKVTDNPEIYARSLYANLRAHDQLHNAAILIEDIPSNDLAWAAIADRLRRASFKE